ncbi:hypothetical protein BCU32_015710 [Vibrio lentus]|uniref:hypothetical protein n=1 Tax=Vibrio lentus TaxID=136468 RepID=UPI000C8378C6|nr:hypothetical protein [Vibrio lentus]
MTMESILDLFPRLPLYKAQWSSLQIEPIVGSGERITVAVCALGENYDYRVVQALSDEVLEFLYRNQKKNMSDLIAIITRSISSHLSKRNTIESWKPPFSGVHLGEVRTDLDIDIDGVIDQGLRFSASLSKLLSPEIQNNPSVQRTRANSRFSNNIQRQVADINPRLISSFNQRVRIVESEAKTSYGFLNDKYVTNFGLLTPSNLSSSLTNIKARIFDIEALKNSDLLFKPSTYEVIVGSPSFNDPTIDGKRMQKIKSLYEMIEEIADKDNIRVYRVNDALEAAERIVNQAA